MMSQERINQPNLLDQSENAGTESSAHEVLEPLPNEESENLEPKPGKLRKSPPLAGLGEISAGGAAPSSNSSDIDKQTSDTQPDSKPYRSDQPQPAKDRPFEAPELPVEVPPLNTPVRVEDPVNTRQLTRD